VSKRHFIPLSVALLSSVAVVALVANSAGATSLPGVGKVNTALKSRLATAWAASCRYRPATDPVCKTLAPALGVTVTRPVTNPVLGLKSTIGPAPTPSMVTGPGTTTQTSVFPPPQPPCTSPYVGPNIGPGGVNPGDYGNPVYPNGDASRTTFTSTPCWWVNPADASYYYGAKASNWASSTAGSGAVTAANPQWWWNNPPPVPAGYPVNYPTNYVSPIFYLSSNSAKASAYWILNTKMNVTYDPNWWTDPSPGTAGSLQDINGFPWTGNMKFPTDNYQQAGLPRDPGNVGVVNAGSNQNMTYYQNSPTSIKKFQDALPSLGTAVVPTSVHTNNLGRYLPVATPNRPGLPTYPVSTQTPGLPTPTFSNNFCLTANSCTTPVALDDYYELQVVDTTQQFSSSLPATTQVRVYNQTGAGGVSVDPPTSMGPIIIARRDVPVRIKLTNNVQKDMFLPVDNALMGGGTALATYAGTYNTLPCVTGPNSPPATIVPVSTRRALIHLHGGNTPWISDGEPHQWITPLNDPTASCLPSGVSQANVPDMPGSSYNGSVGNFGGVPYYTGLGQNNSGFQTYYYPNHQTARFEWYHDHSLGMTRINVYAGIVSGLLLTDDIEMDYINRTNNSGLNPGLQQLLPRDPKAPLGWPLVIQDKSFVNQATGLTGPHTPANRDPLWDNASWGGYGNLWFPHVYQSNELPEGQGLNPLGRWDYGNFLNPPFYVGSCWSNTVIAPNCGGAGGGGQGIFSTDPRDITQYEVPHPTSVTEAFMDTSVVNGVAYPYMTVEPRAYRFRILNGANDRGLNLQLYYANSNTVSDPQSGEANLAKSGPIIYQIGNEGGFLPEVVTMNNPAQPAVFETSPLSGTFGNLLARELWMEPADRADIIIDFTNAAGQVLILYNDLPVGLPAFDTRNDYYTGDPDASQAGGAPPTVAGYGPNTRTIMQFRVQPANTPLTDSFRLNNATAIASLNTAITNAWACNNNGINKTAGAAESTWTQCKPTVLATQQANLQKGVTVYTGTNNPPYQNGPVWPVQVAGLPADPGLGNGFIADGSWYCPPWGPFSVDISNQQPAGYYTNPDGTPTYPPSSDALCPVGPVTKADGSQSFYRPYAGWGHAAWIPVFQRDLIDGVFDNFARMQALIGRIGLAPILNQNRVNPGMGYADQPNPDETLIANKPQMWFVVHAGVDTHNLHFHQFNLEIINRLDLVSEIRLPDWNERGWKEVVHANPLETVFFLLTPNVPPIAVDKNTGASNWGPNWTNQTYSGGQLVKTAGYHPYYQPAVVAHTGTYVHSVRAPDPTESSALLYPQQPALYDYNQENIWHCHILGHEENDMMRTDPVQ
jgi:FtsP/CotA-like multicopper oxidase with cupredoxin domain